MVYRSDGNSLFSKLRNISHSNSNDNNSSAEYNQHYYNSDNYSSNYNNAYEEFNNMSNNYEQNYQEFNDFSEDFSNNFVEYEYDSTYNESKSFLARLNPKDKFNLLKNKIKYMHLQNSNLKNFSFADFIRTNNIRIILTGLIITVFCSVIIGMCSYYSSKNNNSNNSNFTDTLALTDKSSDKNSKNNTDIAYTTLKPEVTKLPDTISTTKIAVTEVSSTKDAVTKSPNLTVKNDSVDSSTVVNNTAALNDSPNLAMTATTKPVTNKTTLADTNIDTTQTKSPDATSSSDEVTDVVDTFISTSITTSSSWKSGNTNSIIYKFTITNNTDEALSNWTATIKFPNDVYVASIWNANTSDKSGTITVTPADWNKTIYADSNCSFEICIYTNLTVTESDLTFFVNE